MSLLVPAAGLVLAGCGRDATPQHRGTEVSVSVSACGHGWTSGKAGAQEFVLHNTDTRTGQVDLIGASSGAVYAEVEPLAEGTTTTLRATLGAGRYAFRCSMEDEPSVLGAPVTLSGSAKGDTPAVVAVSQGDLLAPAKAYEKYVSARLPGLLQLTTVLRADLARGDLAAARQDWLPAHLAYQRLGAAYNAFGDVDADLNGRADGLPHGVHDPSWHGFHRIEYGLWHGEKAASLRLLGDRLVNDVRGLVHDFASAQVDPLDIGIRAHEITEDAVGFALTGRDDYGSHSALATVRADIDGTREVLRIVRPLLAPRFRAIKGADAQLDRSASDIDALRRPDGTWPPLTALDRAVRERINSDISQLAEDLAPVATILEPRRTS
jgi:iron uptake system component EfeO